MIKLKPKMELGVSFEDCFTVSPSTRTYKYLCKTSTGRILVYIPAESQLAYSDDNGDTWGVLHSIDSNSPFYNKTIYCIYVPKEPLYEFGDGVYIGTSQGVFKSADNGVTWSQFASTITGTVYDILVCSYNNTTRVFFASTNCVYWYYSQGSQWRKITTNINGTTAKLFQADDYLYYMTTSKGLWYCTWTLNNPTLTQLAQSEWGLYNAPCCGCKTLSGNYIIGGEFGIRIYNSKYFGSHSNLVRVALSKYIDSLLCLPNGRILAGGSSYSGGIIYSDNEFVSYGWCKYASRDNITMQYSESIGSLCISNDEQAVFAAGSRWVYRSKNAPAIFTREKYLDQNGAQEIVTQFKAYCDAKVGA